MPISVYGNGSIGDTAGTTSDLQSEIIYVGSMDSDTISFPMGWESGYQPASNGSGVVLFQYLTDDSYLWEVSIENMKNPKSFELRYFESLSSQPLITVLEPDTPYPVLPNKLKSSDTISGSKSLHLICLCFFLAVDEFRLLSCLQISPQSSFRRPCTGPQALIGPQTTLTTHQMSCKFPSG